MARRLVVSDPAMAAAAAAVPESSPVRASRPVAVAAMTVGDSAPANPQVAAESLADALESLPVAAARAREDAVDRLSPLASVAATREVLERHGLTTKKSLGQNFLINDDILTKIVTLAQLDERDAVLEVGPGIGTLTIALLKNARCVVSVERDTDLPAVLSETCAPWRDSFRLINKDALELTEGELAEAFGSLGHDGLPSKFIANLPYAVAATIVLDFFERFSWLESATVMVQKEVADRMAAVPGSKNYGAYTVKLGMRAQASGRFPVSPGNFFPPPHVDSAVIRLDRRTPDALAQITDNSVKREALICATCTMADAAFATRRKTLLNSCKTFFCGRGFEGKRIAELLPALFERAGIDAKRRGETLSQEEFIALGTAYLQVKQA